MADRNERARQEFASKQKQQQAAKVMQQFARDLAQGVTGVVDRFGAKVVDGSYIVYAPPYDLIFEVVKLVPVLDLAAPPGMVRLTLRCETTVDLFVGQRSMTMIKCGEKAQDGVAEIQPPGSVPPAGPSTTPLLLADDAAAMTPPDDEPIS